METKSLLIIAFPVQLLNVYLLSENQEPEKIYESYVIYPTAKYVVKYCEENNINKIYINGPIDYVIGVKEHLLALNNNLEIQV